MPQAPYSGVPDQILQDNPTPNISVNAPLDAFGGSVATAIQGLGKATEGAGDELFKRGMAMQELANHSEAQKASADFMEKAGDIHAKLDSMQGKEAVNYYTNGFKKDLQDARASVRGGLSNEMSERLYDTESLSTVGRTLFNGATIAGRANKAYAIDSIDSKITKLTNLAAQSDNPADVAAAKKEIASSAAYRTQLKGQDPDSADVYTTTINSSLDLNVIRQKARNAPTEAKAMLEERRSGMTAADIDRAQTIVDNSIRAVSSVNIAQEVLNSHIGDNGKTDVSFQVMSQEAEAKAKAIAPDDAIMHKHTVDSLKGLFNQRTYADKQFKLDNIQTIDAAIQNGAKDIQQLRLDPKTAEAIDNLPKSEQLKLPARINAYNAAASKVANQESLTRLAGLRNNDVESFLSLDPSDPKLQLNQSQQREVMKWQVDDKKNQNGDPRVNRAMTWLRAARGGELEALKVYHRDGKNPDDYDHMTGTLQSALDLWQESKGKPASYDDVVNTIGPQVIKSRPVAGWLYGTNNEPYFKPDTNTKEYKDFTTNMSSDVVGRGGNEPTPQEVDRAYTRLQLLKLYPARTKSTDGK